jgi:CHAT domain-containing protein
VVSGFQVAGFAHVVGCLWPSMDRASAEIAQCFYTSLLEQDVMKLEGKEIAAALRRSVMAVRAREWKAPLSWAQYVHYGA